MNKHVKFVDSLIAQNKYTVYRMYYALLDHRGKLLIISLMHDELSPFRYEIKENELSEKDKEEFQEITNQPILKL